MTTTTRKTTTEKAKEGIIKYARDIIYVLLFFITISTSIIGWHKSSKAAAEKSSAETQAFKNAIENNTGAMLELKSELKNINAFLMEQQDLNGQFKEFMANHKKTSH